MVVWLALLAILAAPAETQFPGHGQNFTIPCGEGTYLCDDRSCISTEFKCDNTDHCPDGSDEKHCELGSKHDNCTERQFECVSDGECIPMAWRCNLEPDCEDMSDELNCNKTNDPKCEFECGNGRCIPKLWECDEEFDCPDRSDEMNCTGRHKYDHAPPARLDVFCNKDNRYFPCHDSSFCLAEQYVCNGQEDCKDGSDEAPGCEKKCGSVNCSHGCLQTPTGPYCRCPQGFKRNTNETCRDIDECTERHDTCTQRCANGYGNYTCSCDPGYELASDRYTCRATGPKAILFYNTRDSVKAYFFKTNKIIVVTNDTQQAVGITTDGVYVYWTEMNHGQEAIMRASLEDPLNTKEIIVQNGLDGPEDVTIDWLTRVLYFTDSRLSRIGVCSDDGRTCAVLFDQDMHKPRAIVLNPRQGQMYWSDWGEQPKIVMANMDGSDSRPIVTAGLMFPNGLSLDLPNERLYWVDGHSGGIESSKLDGTDRQEVLKDILHHPFWLSVFESNLYWSDWGSNTLQVCEKFTGKSRKTLAKGRVYGIHIYHPALTPQFDHACQHNLCSDLCLLRGNTSYTCVCSEDRQLSPDNHTCHDAFRPQYLLVTGGSAAVRVQYLRLGRLDLVPTHVKLGSIDAVAYNSVNELVYMFDGERKSIDYMRLSDFNEGKTSTLLYNVDKVEDMGYDHVTGVLYWVDSVRRTVEVYSTHTEQRAVIFMFQDETPVSICVLSNYGLILVAMRDAQEEVHVDLFDAGGANRRHVFEQGFKGPRVQVRYHLEADRIFISDSGNRVIETAHPEGTGRETFRRTRTSVYSTASAGPELFWTDRRSSTLYWANVHEATLTAVRRLTLEVFTPLTQLQLTTITARPVADTLDMHPCSLTPSPCSHICVQKEKHKSSAYACVCPVGMFLHVSNGTCETRVHCQAEEVYCHRSNVCVARDRRCNGKPDCLHGEDEEGCADKSKNGCGDGMFKCESDECIAEHLRCDRHRDCLDGSDEVDCHDAKSECTAEQFSCDEHVCVDRGLVCDGNQDCEDGSDEGHCLVNSCAEGQYQCDVGNCIDANWECDGELDCKDGSDEHPQCPRESSAAIGECSTEEMRCNDGECLSASKHCDGHADCKDSSDEQDCIETELMDACIEGYACETNRSICLPQVFKCNGMVECPRGEDEVGCEPKCTDTEFQCADGRCIASEYVCDGFADCRDVSDEAPNRCLSRTNANKQKNCAGRFTCGTGRCLDYSEVCNGFADCDDQSDEHGACEVACQTHRCGQMCTRTPSGSMCRCSAGYELSLDGYTCTDVDECAAAEPACAHLCHNTDGGFVCTCHRGYALKSDKRSCKVTGGLLTILLTMKDEVWSYQWNTASVMVYRADDRIADITANHRANKFYITSEVGGKLYQVSMQPRYAALPITNIGRPTKVAVDWISDNVYLADNTPGSRRLLVCSVRARACAKLHDIEHDHEVTALAVDPENAVVLYCAGGGPKLLYSLYKCTLDGRERTTLIDEELRECGALAADPHSKVVYLSHDHALMRVHYEGTRHKLVNQLYDPSPRRLKLFESKLLYISGTGDLVNCPLYGVENCRYYLPTRSNSLEALALVHPSLQPADVSDACADVTCADSVCVRTEAKEGAAYRCVCPDGSFLDSDSHARCPETAQELLAVFPDNVNARPARSSAVTITLVVLLTLVLIVALVVIVYFRLRATRRAPNAMMVHFRNRPHEQELQRRDGDEPSVDVTPPEPASNRTYTEFVNPLREAWRAMQARVTKKHPHRTNIAHLEVPFADSDSDVESDRDNVDARDKVHLI